MENTLISDPGLLQLLFQHSTEGIVISDEQGLIIACNPATERLFGYPAKELIGKPVEILVPERLRRGHVSQRGEFYNNPAPRPMGAGRDLFGLRMDGTEFPVEISLSAFKTFNGTRVASFVIDISVRKEQEDALRKTKQQLEQYSKDLAASNRELEEFAYVASHDLQEPLRKIQAFGDRLKTKEAGNISEAGKDYLSRMVSAAQRMQQLINDLLTFSRVTTRANPFTQVNMNVLMKDALSDLELAVERSGAEISISELPAVTGDPVQLRQLFMNLIANAIKFTGGAEKPKIAVFPVSHLTTSEFNLPVPINDLDLPEDNINIAVSDNGIGFDEKYADRIFAVFQRLEGNQYTGSGVGLAICKKIATRHNGRIYVRSVPGKGSLFIVSLPKIQNTRSE
ncbi:MAG: PAS domain S-box protein [Bacteroidetes bacterium]|nr:PAS domain S-box protein [Bacteroidota bacterium]